MLRLIARLTADTAGVTFIESAVMWGVVVLVIVALAIWFAHAG